MQILTLRAQLALEAEEERDRQHGKAVVTAADKGTRVTYLLYWYKGTNTDAARCGQRRGAAGRAKETDGHGGGDVPTAGKHLLVYLLV